MTEKMKGYLMVLASALCFSSYGIWSRLIGSHFGVFYQGWIRSAIILSILLPIIIIRKEVQLIKREHCGWFAVTMVLTAFSQVPIYMAFNLLPIGVATLFFYGLFLITSYLIGWAFLSEKITLVKVGAFFLASIGLIVTFGSSLNFLSFSAMLIAAFSGFIAGGEITTTKKISHQYSALLISVYSWAFILITHLPFSILIGEKQLIPQFNVKWLAMFGYAASGLLGFWLVIDGLKYIDASIGALISLLEIIFSFMFGLIFFNEEIAFSSAIGGIIIITAAVLPDAYSIKSTVKNNF